MAYPLKLENYPNWWVFDEEKFPFCAISNTARQVAADYGSQVFKTLYYSELQAKTITNRWTGLGNRFC